MAETVESLSEFLHSELGHGASCDDDGCGIVFKCGACFAAGRSPTNLLVKYFTHHEEMLAICLQCNEQVVALKVGRR